MLEELTIEELAARLESEKPPTLLERRTAAAALRELACRRETHRRQIAGLRPGNPGNKGNKGATGRPATAPRCAVCGVRLSRHKKTAC